MTAQPIHGRGAAPLLAGVDLGTLTCRLLVARVTDGGALQPVHADRRILRLGEGVQRQRRLNPDAMDRVLAVLRQWRRTVNGFSVAAETAVATSAVRDAENRDEFLKRVEQEAGVLSEVNPSSSLSLNLNPQPIGRFRISGGSARTTVRLA